MLVFCHHTPIDWMLFVCVCVLCVYFFVVKWNIQRGKDNQTKPNWQSIKSQTKQQNLTFIKTCSNQCCMYFVCFFSCSVIGSLCRTFALYDAPKTLCSKSIYYVFLLMLCAIIVRLSNIVEKFYCVFFAMHNKRIRAQRSPKNQPKTNCLLITFDCIKLRKRNVYI